MKPGDKIYFPNSLYDEPTSETPRLLLARKGDKGKIVSKGHFAYEWKVETEDKNPFYCNSNEFKLLEDDK